MNCSEASELLSAYYDEELAVELRDAVANHLIDCEHCAYELQSFRSLSSLSESLTDAALPAQIWQQLEVQLDREGSGNAERPTIAASAARKFRWTSTSVMRIGLATAAAILIATGWFGHRIWRGHDERQMTVVFDRYLEAFGSDPLAAQRILLSSYESQELDAQRAVDIVGYRPVVADGMPEGYSVVSTYVLRMPCCLCVQCLCQRSDGAIIAIFEHDDEEPDWFGERRKTEADCNGARCSLVVLDDRIAATWRRGKRHITVIGAQSDTEVGRLAAWFDNRNQLAMNAR